MNHFFIRGKSLFFVFFACFFFCGHFFVFSIDYFKEGEKLFRENNPSQAIPLLYQASQQSQVDPRVFVYLGLCYQQEGKFSDAVSTFIKGTSYPGADKKILFFNAGNIYFSQRKCFSSDNI